MYTLVIACLLHVNAMHPCRLSIMIVDLDVDLDLELRVMKRKATVFDNAQMSSLMANIKKRQTVVNIVDLNHKEHRVVAAPSHTIAMIIAHVNSRAHPSVPTGMLCLIKDDATYCLQEGLMVKDCNLVDGDNLELWSLERYSIMLKSRLLTRSATRSMEAYLQVMEMD